MRWLFLASCPRGFFLDHDRAGIQPVFNMAGILEASFLIEPGTGFAAITSKSDAVPIMAVS